MSDNLPSPDPSSQPVAPAAPPPAPPLEPSTARHAFEWGLASLLCSGLLLVCVPIVVLLVLTMSSIGRHTMGELDVVLALIGACLTVAVVLGLLLTSFIAAVKSLLSARARKQPLALGCLGLLVTIGSLSLWVAAAVAAFGVLINLL